MSNFHPFSDATVRSVKSNVAWEGLEAGRLVLCMAISEMVSVGNSEKALFVTCWSGRLGVDGYLVFPPDERHGCKIESTEELLRRLFTVAKARGVDEADDFRIAAKQCGIAGPSIIQKMADAIDEMKLARKAA